MAYLLVRIKGMRDEDIRRMWLANIVISPMDRIMGVPAEDFLEILHYEIERRHLVC